MRLESGFCRNLRNGQFAASKKVHGAAYAERYLVFKRRHSVVFSEPFPEQRVAHSTLFCQRREIDNFPKVMRNVEVGAADGYVV